MEIVIFVVVLIMSVVIHEVAHAWQARREGDYTADQLGRITLNPIPHLDPIGSFLFPLALYMMFNTSFGWARPVPVNPANFRHPRAGDIRVSLAGIVSNLVLALAFTIIGAAVVAGGIRGIPLFVCQIVVSVNIGLAFFNLIPIPPLDGSHVVDQLLPARLKVPYRRAGQFGFLILLALVFIPPFRGVLTWLLLPGRVLYEMAMSFMFRWI